VIIDLTYLIAEQSYDDIIMLFKRVDYVMADTVFTERVIAAFSEDKDD
jgi:hypothetical protein